VLNAGVLSKDGTGRIRHSNTNPTDFNGGTPIVVVGGANLLASFNNAPEVYVQGAPYTASGALCGTTFGAVVSYTQGGLPLTLSNEVAVDVAEAISFYNAGLPYTATGKLAIALPE
jgi:hypothetical protein